MSEILWTPSDFQIERSQVTIFRHLVNERYGLELDDTHALHGWSTRDPEQFWESVWDYAVIRYSRHWDRVLENGNKMPGARWFTGARLNFAENLLRHRDGKPALIFKGENGTRRSLTSAELYRQVACLASTLHDSGIGIGDRVAGFMPNIPETVIAMLATASLGALWSSCSPDFGIKGVLDRFGQIEPKALFTASSHHYAGKRHDDLVTLRGLLAKLPSVERVVVSTPFGDQPDLSGLRGAMLFDEALAAHPAEEIDFVQLPFDHPLYIMYSSGTTGLPKCMVHSAGGTLIQHLKEHVLHGDLTREDRIFYFTTCGWMMWNWLISALAVGATVMLYDGSPFHPPEVLWDYARDEGMTVFGTSAKYIAAMEKEGLEPAATHDIGGLHAILSTGSPLAPESFDYVYAKIKKDVRLSSISGGTDIISCFALGNPALPVIRGELQSRGLGMGVEIFDEAGNPVEGRKGELVCTAPFPSMPVSFWNDPDGTRYRKAYFNRFPGVWTHGDYAELRPSGGLVIHGRSDAVLNPGGVRIGTAEIYRVVENFDEVMESLAVGQEWEDDVRVILFVRLAGGLTLDTRLRDRIRRAIRREESPRHVPARIIQVPDIPRTISGKIVELAVREVIHGRPVKNRDALANPEALEYFNDLPELSED